MFFSRHGFRVILHAYRPLRFLFFFFLLEPTFQVYTLGWCWCVCMSLLYRRRRYGGGLASCSRNRTVEKREKHLISQLIFRFKLPGPLVASGDFPCPSAGSVQRDTPYAREKERTVYITFSSMAHSPRTDRAIS